ncbi:MAG: hypothetical protein JNJ54_33820 [Myxococcaceae bacterium]|nr:hypothetical protein [Myxococcaceae bacterium]
MAGNDPWASRSHMDMTRCRTAVATSDLDLAGNVSAVAGGKLESAGETPRVAGSDDALAVRQPENAGNEPDEPGRVPDPEGKDSEAAGCVADAAGHLQKRTRLRSATGNPVLRRACFGYLASAVRLVVGRERSMATRWKADVAVRVAEQALELAKPHTSKLEQRLAAGFFDSLKTDAAIARANGDVQASRASKRAATVSQDEAVRGGSELVNALRGVIRSGAPNDKALWKAFGVGTLVKPSVRSVSESLSTVLAGANKYPSETAAVGILADDIARARNLLDSIADVDADQEAKKVTSKQATAQLYAAIDRLSNNVTHLARIARVALPSDVAAEFAEILPSSPKKKTQGPS